MGVGGNGLGTLRFSQLYFKTTGVSEAAIIQITLGVVLRGGGKVLFVRCLTGDGFQLGGFDGKNIDSCQVVADHCKDHHLEHSN